MTEKRPSIYDISHMPTAEDYKAMEEKNRVKVEVVFPLNLGIEIVKSSNDEDKKDKNSESKFSILCCNYGPYPIVLEKLTLGYKREHIFTWHIPLKDKFNVESCEFKEIPVRVGDIEKIKKDCVEKNIDSCDFVMRASGREFVGTLDLKILREASDE